MGCSGVRVARFCTCWGFSLATTAGAPLEAVQSRPGMQCRIKWLCPVQGAFATPAFARIGSDGKDEFGLQPPKVIKMG